MNASRGITRPDPGAPHSAENRVLAWFRRHARLVLVLLFIATILLVVQLTGIRQHFELDFIRAQFEHHLITGTATFILLFALGNLIQIPGWIFLAAAVLALGQIWGAAVTYVAAVMSCILIFLLIRLVGGDALRNLDSGIARRLLQQLDRRPVWSQFWLRTLFQTAPALNYTLALSGVRLRDYCVALLIGLPLPIVLYSLFIDYLAMAIHPA